MKGKQLNESSLDDYKFTGDFYYMMGSNTEVNARISNCDESRSSEALAEFKKRTKSRPDDVPREEWNKKVDAMDEKLKDAENECKANMQKIGKLMRSLVEAELAKFEAKVNNIK